MSAVKKHCPFFFVSMSGIRFKPQLQFVASIRYFKYLASSTFVRGSPFAIVKFGFMNIIHFPCWC